MSTLLNEILSNTKNKTERSVVNSFFKNTKIKNNISEKTFLKKIRDYNKSDETKKKLLGVIGRTMKYPSFQREYTDIMRRLNQRYKKNEPNSEKERRALKISYEMLYNKLPEVYKAPVSKRGLIYVLLVGIENTPRLDYRTLIYYPRKTIKATKKDSDLNYICRHKGKYIIVLNKYKNSKYHAQWVINVEDDKVNHYINRYLKTFSVKKGDFIFRTLNGTPFTSSSFSSFVSNTFNNIIGTPIDISTLRKVKAMSLIHRNPKILELSLDQKNKLALELLRHTYDNSALYYNKVKEDTEEK